MKRFALLPILFAAPFGCDSLTSDRDGMRARVYGNVQYEQVYRGTVEAIHGWGGSIKFADPFSGKVESGYQKYNPAALGAIEIGRFTNPGGYRSKAEAIVERSGDGARVNLRVIVEREEFEKRQGMAALAPSDIFHDDRAGPSTPLQESIYNGGTGAAGGRWVRYRIDTTLSESILREIDRKLRPEAAPDGTVPDTTVPQGPQGPAPKTDPAPTTDPAPMGAPKINVIPAP